MRERVLAMVEIWTQPKPEFHGEHVDFAPILTWPKPLQSPHPPLHVGGGFPNGARRAVEYGNGWMPIFGRDRIIDRLPELRRMLVDAGRDPASFEVSIFGIGPKREELEKARDAGISRVIFGLPPEPAEKLLPLLDRHAELARSVG